MLAAILKISPTDRENVPSGHFERKKKKKGLLLPIFRKNRTLNMFVFLFGLKEENVIINIWSWWK